MSNKKLVICRVLMYTKNIKFTVGGGMKSQSVTISLPDNYLSEEDAKKILEPHLDVLTNCFKAAWQKWQRFSTDSSTADLRYPLSPRTRACFIYDHICHEIKHQFNEISG